MTRPARPALKIDVLVASDIWKKSAKTAKTKTTDRSAKAIVRRAVSCAATAVPSTSDGELAIVLADDAAIRLLNLEWRSVDAATNVLSFPARPAPGEKAAEHLGDIVLAFETIAREAQSEGKPFAHHLAHLAVHGFLHLVGYDHEREADARVMEGAERNILRQLAIPDPYRPRPRPARPLTPRAGRPASEESAKSKIGRAAKPRVDRARKS
jgi:probable rRNA maturation factor